MSGNLDELRIADVATFLTALRAGSVTAAARKLGVTPSQVSKAVGRLEGFLNFPLVARAGRGVALTERAMDLRSDMEELVRRAEDLPKRRDTTPNITVAAPSYLAASFFGPLCGRISDARLRVFEASPATIRACADEGSIDMALTLARETLPPSWMSTRVGAVRIGLFTSPKIAKLLGKSPNRERLRSVPFIIPFQHSNGQFVPGSDGCPLPVAERTRGHSASTIGIALEIAAQCDQLAYGPALAARRFVAEGRLVPVDSPGLAGEAELFLHLNTETVLARIQREALSTLEDALHQGQARR
jgi:DNA-binding transcriptional LysR family regulator